MYDFYNTSSESGFEMLGKAIDFIAQNFWGILIIGLFLAFIIKLLIVMFWTSVITDLVTKRLEKEYNQRIELMIRRLEPKENKQTKPKAPIDVSKYENPKIKL